MTIKASPTLSAAGWVTSVADILDVEFANFMASDFYQSNVYAGKIASLPYLIKTYASDLSELRSKSKATLTAHLERFFDSTSIEVETSVSELDDSKVSLSFAIAVVRDGNAYNFVKAIADINSKTLKLMELNNG